ncbi:dipeptidase [Flaviflexus ciconiae]|uniref:Dipeptidase n=1 Tax=Flaviflexus ciconiae TaxID=2496867 RepID=A0A3S9PVK7_9ACTO|nr:dipeptidase [Flaviflexus ciconiae]AZQ76342.1 dipeptidase [Flaviflexus ciconiae]
MTDLATYSAAVDAALPAVRSELEDLVRIPSVSSSAFDQSELDRSAQKVTEILRDSGFTDIETIKLATESNGTGRPAILAHREGPAGAPTVMLYAHHDVQPPGERDTWDTEPFEPVEKDGRLYGRGTADDKAGILVHAGAIRALDSLGELPVSVTVFIEGEEEIGSPTFVDFLNEYRDRLAADVIVVADSNNWTVDVPSLTTSLRGVVGLEVTVDVLDHALHSGMYGGPVLDAVTVASRLIATLHDENGSVAVAGLHGYDDADADYPEDQLRNDTGVLEGVELVGKGSMASRLWTQPALSVIGLDATSVEKSSNTIIPSCRFQLSLRTAPGQQPAEAHEALKKHIVEHAPFGAKVSFGPGELGPAFQAEQTGVMETARGALRDAWQTEPVDIGVGGSIPFIADLAKVFPQAEILVTGIEDPDTRAHSGNESLHLGVLRNAILAEALLLARLAE